MNMLKTINLRNAIVVALLAARPAFPQTAAPAKSADTQLDSANKAALTHRRSVKLAWRASVPGSKLPRDAVAGYNIYRSETPHDPKAKRINSKLCDGTTYTDEDVTEGKTYYYVVKGIAVSGEEGAPSKEIEVTVRPHE